MAELYDGPLAGMFVDRGDGVRHFGYCTVRDPMRVRYAEYFFWPDTVVAVYIGDAA